MHKKEAVAAGVLRVVGVPIGNLGDVSARASAALGGADIIACEDTRRTGQLLQLLGIKAPRLVSCHKDNEQARAEELVASLRAGQQVALVSDSGMPGISDPGARLVAAVRAAGLKVEVLPGPNAAAVAVAGSGIEGPFVFLGFLPRGGKGRRDLLARVGRYPETVVLYEAPGRVAATAADLLEAWGNRPAWLARELTKLHEEWVGPDLQNISAALAGRELKGECVLVIGGAGENPVEAVVVTDGEILSRLESGEKTKAVAAWLASVAGLSQRAAYQRVLQVAGAE